MKKILALVLILILVFSMVACTTTSPLEESKIPSEASQQPSKEAPSEVVTEPEDKGSIGVISLSLAAPLAVNLTTGIKQAAEEYGYGYMEIDSAANPEKEVAGIETFAASNVKAFYTITISGDMVYNTAKETGTDMGVLTQSAPPEPCDARVVENDEALTQMFVESLQAFMEEKGMAEAQVVFLWLAGSDMEGSANAQHRETCLAEFDKLTAGTGITMAAEFVCADNVEAGTANTETALNANPDATVFFCYNNDMAIASANTISAAIADPSNYFVFSSESDAETFRLIADANNPMRACGDYDQVEQGYRIGLQLIAWAQTGKMEDVSVNKVLVDWRNIAEYTG